VAFLESGGLGEPIERRIDTHGAIVFLGHEQAWKMKQAVRYGFMDFSTLAKRERALRAELALTWRTAPGLYRAVLPITRKSGDGLAVGGPGRPIEWLLAMRRFPTDGQLDRIAAGGGLTPLLVEALARTIAAFHEEAEPRPEHGGTRAMREVVEGNAADLLSLTPVVLPPDAVAVLNAATLAELDR
jgi:aminoglycoside phosphotransferase family enzyme